MNTIVIEKNQVKMIAHRGVSGLEAENTCAAFVAAGNRSYYGIETDIHVTKDNKIAVIHDARTNRVSAVDKIVAESTLEELQGIPLYDNAKDVYRTDLRIPTLSDYISICKRYDKKAVLELKRPMTQESIALVVDIIKEMDFLEHVIFISFIWENLVVLRNMLPDQKIQFLTDACDDVLIEKLVNHKIDLDICYGPFTKELVDILHQNGLEINCWTVDNPERAKRLIDWGVDYITSNILE